MKLSCLMCLLWFLPQYCLAESSTVHHGFKIHNWSANTPPPIDIIYDLSDGPGGYIWLFSTRGLYYFNGVNYFKYEIENTKGADDPVFLDLVQDDDKNLWALSLQGLIKISVDMSYAFFPAPRDYPINYGRGLTVDRLGNLWVALGDKVYWMDDGRFEEVFHSPFGDIHHIYGAAGEGFWVQQEGQVVLIQKQGKPLKQVTLEGLPIGFSVSTFSVLNASQFILAGLGHFQLYQDGKLKEHILLPSLGRAFDIAVYDGGHLIAAEHGLAYVREGELELIDLSELGETPSLRFRFLYTDSMGKVWFGGWRTNLYSLEPNSASVISGSPDYAITRLVLNPETRLVGTMKGLKYIKHNQQELLVGLPDAIGERVVVGVTADRDRNLLTVSSFSGIFQAQQEFPLVFKRLDAFGKARYAEIHYIGQDIYLAASFDGLYEYHHKTRQLRLLLPDGETDGNRVYGIVDAGPWGWVVVFDHGISFYRDGSLSSLTFTEYTDDQGEQQPTQLGAGAYDPVRDLIWIIGIRPNHTVHAWKNGELFSVRFDDGLKTDRFYQVMPDRFNNLWIAHEYGLFRLRIPMDLSQLDSEPLPLDVIDFKPGTDECGQGTPDRIDEKLYFACINGYIEINPKDYQHGIGVPETRLVDMAVNGQAVSFSGGPLQFPADSRSYEFNYTARYLTPHSKVSFRSRLLGFDETWRKLDTQSLKFSHLPSGDYAVEVQSRADLGPWSDTSRVSFSVLPPFYQTLWFLMVASLLLLLTGYGVHRIRTVQLNRSRRILKQLVAAKTHSLEESNLALEESNEALQIFHQLEHERAEAEISRKTSANELLQAAITDKSDELRGEMEARLRLERQLTDAHKMELVGELSTGVAHDFNNMLGVIRLSAESIEYKAAEDNLDSNTLDSLVEMIYKAVNKSEDVISQLMNFGKEDVQIEVINLTQEVADSYHLARAAIPSSVEIDLSLSKTPLYVAISRSKLNQIVLNLIVNARDACESLGTIHLGLNRLEVKSIQQCTVCNAEISGDMIELTIRDSGVGIEPDKIGKIFDSYYTTKSTEGGSGIGLRVVSSCTHEAQGHIYVESKLSEYTSISIYLPVQDPPEFES